MSQPGSPAKLLRVLDDGDVRPVGSRVSRMVSVRFLSATNRNSENMVRDGSLREDLYYRLRGFDIRLTPLRERPEDIAPLVAHLLGAGNISLTPDALTALESFAWPGNVRQLCNVVRCAMARTTTGLLDRKDLTFLPGEAKSFSRARVPASGVGTTASGSLKELERQAILQALRDSNGNRLQTANALGIHRSTLRRKMLQLGIPS